MSIINVHHEIALAQAEIARLTAERDEARAHHEAAEADLKRWIVRVNERDADVSDLRARLARLRELAAAVVQSHDAPGGCRGPVGWTAMQALAEAALAWEDAEVHTPDDGALLPLRLEAYRKARGGRCDARQP